MFKLGKGANGSVYRYVLRADTTQTFVRKVYTSHIVAAIDAVSMSSLRKLFKKLNFPGVKIVDRARPLSLEGKSRYYQDVRGETLSDLLDSKTTPPELREILLEKKTRFNKALYDYLESTYIKAGRKYTFSNVYGYDVEFRGTPVIGINLSLRQRNIIVDHKTLEFVFIDPN